MSPAVEGRPALHVEDLYVHLPTTGRPVRAVDGVSFTLGAGEALGVVGESGSGKSMMARALLHLVPRGAVVTGSARYGQHDLLALRGKDLDAVRGSEVAMVFQDPGRALNPVVKVGRQLTEGMRRHLGLSASAARSRAVELLDEVGVSDPERRLTVHPHELSGGMRQRVMIAMALACEPTLLIADEPTTALDVTIQRQILDLLQRLQRDRGMSLLLISHDLAVVGGRTDRVSVMYAGQMAETGPTDAVFAQPRHRYTDALLSSTPTVEAARHARLPVIEGSLPDPTDPAPGCRFAARCPAADTSCHQDLGWDEHGSGHWSRCAHPVGTPRVEEVAV